MIGFESTIQKILFGAAMYVTITSFAIFVHWMWFSNYDMVIGRKMKKNTLKKRRVMMGLALPSSYYASLKQKELQEMEGKAA